jgi:2-phospho-L-lactate guanylyltransferase
MPDVRADGDQWSLLIPVKRLDIAKTRLALPEQARTDLALAMACDTVAAALRSTGVAEVVVITNDVDAGAALAALGARVIDDAPDRGLNAAFRHGASVAVSPRFAALAGDLPALRSSDLTDVLNLGATHRVAVVADDAGTGTTTLLATSIDAFAPQFGTASRAAHVSGGAVDLSDFAARSIRHDVDTIDALRIAVEWGVGPATTQILSTLSID